MTSPDTYAGARIARMEIIPLQMPMKTPVKISHGAARPCIDTLLVRLTTESGLTGVGETQAWRRQGSAETLASLAAVLRDHFQPLVVGRSPFSLASIMARLEQAMWHSLYAQAAVSDALYDLQGKILGVPVHALLGGRCRASVPACVVLFMKPTVEQTVEGAAEFQARGYRSFTVKVGVDARQDVRLVAALRERLGPDAILRVDANAGMDFDGALSLLRKLEPYDIDAAEQLLPLGDVAGMAELARRSPIPLMVDESLASDGDLIDIVCRRAGTAIHTKIGKNGGIWGVRKLMTIAGAAGLRIYPGNHPSTSVATLAAAHVATAWDGPLLDGAFTVGIDALADDVVREPVRIEGNAVEVSDAPGLGVELDEDKLRAYRADL
ncbi:dipeptide epimerase [Pigmentiphaga soli]|uniref:Dipeptide epimerase n=1 Tax=Pigmentiphaga soli TaxID=1007095 RepID=A0ABP8HLM3_9BURK